LWVAFLLCANLIFPLLAGLSSHSHTAMSDPAPIDSPARNTRLQALEQRKLSRKATTLLLRLSEKHKGAIQWTALAPAYFLQVDKDGVEDFAPFTEEDITALIHAADTSAPHRQMIETALPKLRTMCPTHAHIIGRIWQNDRFYIRVMAMAPRKN